MEDIELFRRNGRRIANLRLNGVLREFGLTELFSESSEPPFTELRFEEFKRLFPEGNYRFEGETIDGRKLESVVPFSHGIMNPPVFIRPEDSMTMPADDAVIEWAPVDRAVSYQVVVTRADPTRVLDMQLPAGDTTLAIPAEFLDPGVEYKIEVQAFNDGSHIFTEGAFTVE